MREQYKNDNRRLVNNFLGVKNNDMKASLAGKMKVPFENPALLERLKLTSKDSSYIYSDSAICKEQSQYGKKEKLISNSRLIE